MSIILLLSAAMSVAATGGTAPGPSGSVVVGRSQISVGSWQRGGRGPGLDRHRPFRPGFGRGPGRHHRHPGRHGRGGDDFLFSYGADGLAGPYEAVDPHGNGFFAGGGGLVSVSGGRAHYDYDRSYPYEWASGESGRRDEAEGRPPATLCGIENGVRVCRGGR